MKLEGYHDVGVLTLRRSHQSKKQDKVKISVELLHLRVKPQVILAALGAPMKAIIHGDGAALGASWKELEETEYNEYLAAAKAATVTFHKDCLAWCSEEHRTRVGITKEPACDRPMHCTLELDATHVLERAGLCFELASYTCIVQAVRHCRPAHTAVGYCSNAFARSQAPFPPTRHRAA